MNDEASIEALRIGRRLAMRALAGLTLLSLLLVALAAGALGSAWFAGRLTGEAGWVLALPWWLTAIAGAALAWRLGGCLFALAPPPEGVALTRQLAPSLYALCDLIGRDCGGRPVDTVWITGDINAAVLRRPRWGLLGPMETHLLIGLPLAHSVSERQFTAIVAHEYGHLAMQHDFVDAWGAQLRSAWFRAVERCIERLPFFGALLDRLTRNEVGTALRLARIEEFEADRVAADAVGAGLLAETLVEVAARERFLRCDFWVKVMAQCTCSPRPSMRPYRDMGLGLVAGFLPGDGRGDCLRSMHDEGDALHPTLAERLAALGEMPASDTRIEDSVAERHLSLLLPRLAWELDRAWWAEMRSEWRDTYRRSCPDASSG
jgi:Zn-dependent protease with chaperone function